MLQIELRQQPDGTGLIRCTRADGSLTWQTHTRHAAHFAHHDLTHFAVETTLGYQNAFFGLIAQGWDLDDTTGKGVRGPLPPEAVACEKIVGLFDTERASGAIWTLDEFNQMSPRPLTLDQVTAIRTLRGRLFADWADLEPGESLVLSFPV